MSQTVYHPDAPAFPTDNEQQIGPITYHYSGMSLRAWFAGQAMAGLLADHKDHGDELLDGETCSEAVARLAVEHADELILALNRTPSPKTTT